MNNQDVFVVISGVFSFPYTFRNENMLLVNRLAFTGFKSNFPQVHNLYKSFIHKKAFEMVFLKPFSFSNNSNRNV